MFIGCSAAGLSNYRFADIFTVWRGMIQRFKAFLRIQCLSGVLRLGFQIIGLRTYLRLGGRWFSDLRYFYVFGVVSVWCRFGLYAFIYVDLVINSRESTQIAPFHFSRRFTVLWKCFTECLQHLGQKVSRETLSCITCQNIRCVSRETFYFL